MSSELQVALISGPAYDPLYASLPGFVESTGIRVNVAFTGDHPAINHHLASLAEVPYDLVSTHTKYAPSQLGFLATLDDLLESSALDDFVPLIVQMARVEGVLYAVPRNIDVRLLHYRTDLIDAPPATCCRATSTASSNLPSRISRAKTLLPVTFVRSPIIVKLVSGR